MHIPLSRRSFRWLLAAALAGAAGAMPGAPVVDASLLDRRPAEVSAPKPDYPPGFRESGEKGMVILELLVNPDGRVAEALVTSSTDARLSTCAAAAALKWTFSPPRKSGVPVYARIRVSMGFGPGEFGSDDKAGFTPPEVTFQARPEYPFSLRLSGVKGEVLAEFTVDPEGRVIQPEVIRSTHPDFEAPTIEALLQWRFRPGTRNGHTVYVHMEVPVIFQLEFGSGPPGGREAWSVPRTPSRKLPAELQYDEPPRPVLIGAPVYPFDLLLAGVKGKAAVSFAIDPAGRTRQISVESASRPEFGAAAAAMVAAWRFDPAMKDGKPSWSVLRREQSFSRSGDDFPLSDSALRLLKDLGRSPCPILGSVAGLDAPLKGRYQPAPIVPASVSEANLPEEAEISFIVDRAGRAQLPRIDRTTSEDFGWAAATAVGRWQFNAPTVKGRPVDVRVTVPIDYRPRKAENPPPPAAGAPAKG